MTNFHPSASPLFASVHEIYSHCTVTAILPSKPDQNIVPLHPILLYLKDHVQSLPTSTTRDRFLLTKVAFSKRRQPQRFCRTYIFPTLFVNLFALIYSPLFPPLLGSAYSTQIISLTSLKLAHQEMQLLSRNVLSTDINYWGCREFYLVTEGVRFYHLNWYDRRKKRMSEFGAFSEIPCISGRCFDSVEKIGEEVAAKYNFISWVYIGWMDGDSRTGSFTPKFRAIHAKYFSSRDKKNEWTQFLAKEKIESFDEFMAYVVLAEALTNATPTTEKISLKEKYVYRGVHNAMRIANPHQIVLFGSRGYGFLSCYGIKENPYEFFTNPFDKFEWMSVFLAVFALGLINSDPVDVALAGFAVLLEISVPLATKRSVPGKVKCIFWLWVFAAIVLTSLYKDAFTTELIAPFKRSLTWRHVHELGDQGFKVFLPLKPNDAGLAESYSNGAQIKDLFAFDFSMDMQKITGGDLTDLPRLLGHRRFATAVLNTLIMGRKKRIGEKLTSAYFHYKWPAHVYPNLSRCDKSAYLDEKENIKVKELRYQVFNLKLPL